MWRIDLPVHPTWNYADEIIIAGMPIWQQNVGVSLFPRLEFIDVAIGEIPNDHLAG